MNNGDDVIKITGTIENVRYFKEEWGIIEVSVNSVKSGKPKTNKSNRLIAKGTMPTPIEGNEYLITAAYVTHPTFGGQYDIISICQSANFETNDAKGQKKFLSALYTPQQIENMYEALDNPYDVLKNSDSQELVKVKGCGLKTAERWISKFQENLALSFVLTELDDYNLTNLMINKLVKAYKSPELVVEKVKNNPYILCNDIEGIGWKTADKIAMKSGMDEFDVKRISAYINKYLTDCGNSGYSWITADELMGRLLDVFGDEIPDKNISESIHFIEDKLWWNEDKSKIGLKLYYDIETKIAKELIRIRDAESNVYYKDWETTVKGIEQCQGWNYTDEQKKGIKKALDNNIVLIQGLAGTGKSTLVNAIIQVLKGYRYVQCALSGRASSRMAEITGEEGFTIHRLLGYPQGDKNGFVYHDECPLNQDIIIIDEVSMIDSFLFYYLLRAVRDGAKVIMLGDPGQLESIGSGNIIHDVFNSGEIPTVSLTQIHRQASSSAIITESIKIRNGVQLIEKNWVGTETRGELQDLTLNCYSDITNTFYNVMQTFSAQYSNKDFDIMQNQIIVPSKERGTASVYELNNAVQELYNPADGSKKEYTVRNVDNPYVLREGDKVINMVNNYKTSPMIYNGNMGILRAIKTDYDEAEDKMVDVLIIDFQGIGRVSVPKEYWRNIQLGYAITVHKSQGSQWNNVIVGVDFSSYSLLSRELLYTAITRSKKHCTLIAQTGALRMAIGKEGVSTKQTHLKECLYEVAHPKLIF